MFKLVQRGQDRDVSREVVELGYTDDRGRKVMAIIYKHTAELAERDEAVDHAWKPYFESETGAGVYYFVEVTAGRDGKRFGAAQRGASFLTEADRDAYVEARLATSRKYAAKKFSKEAR